MRISQYILPDKISRNIATPVYSQIYSQLKKELALGGYAPGQRFYSYRKLKDIYGVELRTVGAAINLLLKDKLLEKRATSGIYVTDMTTSKESISEVGNIWYVVIGGEQLSHPFYFNIFQGLESEANKYGLRIIVGIKSNAEEFLQWFKPKPGEGLIIAGELTREMLMEAGKRCNDNIVVAGNCDFTGNFGSVTTNYLTALNKSMEMAVEYGCQRIGVITGPMNRLVSRDLLYSAEDCRGRHPEKIKAVVSYANIDEDGFKAMTALEKDKPDCILVTEPAFPGVWEYMLKNNLKCPDDIFIIRYGKEIQGRWYPNLAAVNLEIDSLEHGYASLQMLLENSKNTVKIDVKVVTPTPR